MESSPYHNEIMTALTVDYIRQASVTESLKNAYDFSKLNNPSKQLHNLKGA
jgi:hypothetical protein